MLNFNNTKCEVVMSEEAKAQEDDNTTILKFHDWLQWAEQRGLFLKPEDAEEGKMVECVAIDDLGFRACTYPKMFGIERDTPHQDVLQLFQSTGTVTIKFVALPYARNSTISKPNGSGVFRPTRCYMDIYSVQKTYQPLNGRSVLWYNGQPQNDAELSHESGNQWLQDGSGDGWTRYISLDRLKRSNITMTPGIIFSTTIDDDD